MTVLVATAATLGGARLHGQAPAAAAAPSFEVASVKPNASGASLQSYDFRPGDRVTIVNLSLRALIRFAYRPIDAARIVGGPSWIDNDRFDITAKAAAPTSPAQLTLMLRTLLADRFQLAAHTETRDDSIYALVIARSDGRLGPNLHPAAADCATLRATAPAGWAQPNGSNPCGNLGGIPPGAMIVRGVPLIQLGVLAGEVGRKIVDKTGLTGNFDWDLTWTPQASQERPFDRQRFPTVDPDGPSIFTALQEQLGLKLESQRDMSEFLVIDGVERPSED